MSKKILHCFCNVSHNSGTLDSFAEDVNVTNHTDIFQVLLVGFASMAGSTASESMLLCFPGIAWSSKFCHLFTVLWSTVLSPFAQQMFLAASAALWPYSKS